MLRAPIVRYAVEVEAAASRRLYARSGADRWQVSAERLHSAVERSLDHRFSGAATGGRRRRLPRIAACRRPGPGLRVHRRARRGLGAFHPRASAAALSRGANHRGRRRPRAGRLVVRRVVRSPRQGRGPTLAARALPRPQPADHVAAIGARSAAHRPSPCDPAARAARRRGFRRFDARSAGARIRTRNAISWSVTRSGRSTPASTRSRQRTGCDSASITART